MGTRKSELPFARGETYFQGDASLISASVGKHLEGTRYWVKDNRLPPTSAVYGGPVTNRQPTGGDVELIILRAANSSPAAGRLRPKEGVFMSSHQFRQNRVVKGHSGTAGDLAYPVDEFYVSSIAAGDLFYAVINGLTQVKTDRNGQNFTAAGTVSWSTRGRVKPFITSTHHHAGQIDRAISSGVTSIDALVLIGQGYKIAT